MDLSPIGQAVLEAREGNELVAYRDSVGVLTIGAGVTTASGLITVTPGLRLTAAQAAALNARAFAQYAGHVREAVGSRPIEQHQFDAFVSVCFNIGPGGFAGSTFLRRFMAGDLQGCADAMLMWKKPAVIIPRRQAEADQFLTPYARALPKRVRTDRVPIARPAPASPFPPKIAPKPAPTGGLSSAPSPAPTTAGPGGLFGNLLTAIRANLAKGA